MLQHNGFYAQLQDQDGRKLPHSELVIQNNSTVTTTVACRKERVAFGGGSTQKLYEISVATHSRGQRILPPQSCLIEVFLFEGRGEEVLVGSALMDEKSTQSCQVQNGTGLQRPQKWLHTPVPNAGLRRVKISVSYGVRDIEYSDCTPTIFKFNIVLKPEGSIPRPARPVGLIKELKSLREDYNSSSDGEKRKKRKRKDSCSGLTSSDLDGKHPRLSISVATSSGSSGLTMDLKKQLDAERQKKAVLQKRLEEKLSAMKKENAEMLKMLDD
ncbi:hypothetical protein B0H17DRAFT_1128721 [Mycena rosella]|uniref:Uncharacterized protein n=1 Tax=Mycena rosella TaxID=1033263 RepID=A0AAD7DVR9_MYCRO|nr:hypothetical protein B0H17DRAFT_1128721 [Mycena rosella]